MNVHGMQRRLSGEYLIGSLALLFLAYPALCADKSKSAPAKAPAPARSSPKPAGGGSHGPSMSSHGASTSSHGPTTSSHGPTTTSHGPTTTSHGATTSSHGTTTATHGPSTSTSTGHTTTPNTTAGHPNTAAGHTNTTAGHPNTEAGHTNTTAGHPNTAAGHTNTMAGHTNTAPGRSNVAGGHNAGVTSHGTPMAKGHTTVQTRNGMVTKRPDGHVATLHDTRRGMEVHHNLSGNRRVVVERRDHSRVVVEHGGRGYVQRPYRYHGREYARRSYYYHGRYYHAYYGRYYYHGVWVNPYYPTYYYAPAYYGWVYNPWVRPVPYAWGWAANPWYGYYGAYFTPYPVYASASLWLTDYIISTSLQAAYQAQVNAAALSNPAPLTPEVKQLIADEVKDQIALENAEAKNSGQNADPNDASTSIQRSLTDGKQHVFVAGHDLDVVDAGGTECALSEGDAIQLTGPIAPDATSATLAVLASKGGRECPRGDTVSIALDDLQDMQNHMRETIDQGMQELQAKQGQGGLPAAPSSAKAAPVENALAAAAPPPPPENEVAAEIKDESQEADRAEGEAGAPAGPGPNAEAPPPAPVNIEMGQTIDQVTQALGTPTRIVNLGAKKIYVYKDMKITFKDGKVADVQ